MAAVMQAHVASGVTGDENDIPEIALAPPAKDGKGKFGRDGGGFKGDRDRKGSRPYPSGNMSSGPMTRIFVGVGRAASVRPQDLVGAIANETTLSGRQIGAIDITDKFSLVEIPESSANEVIATMRKTTIKGHKAVVRRDKNTSN